VLLLVLKLRLMRMVLELWWTKLEHSSYRLYPNLRVKLFVKKKRIEKKYLCSGLSVVLEQHRQLQGNHLWL
jgi:hypothetical protein